VTEAPMVSAAARCHDACVVTDAGARYVNALAAKDIEALLDLFAADIVLRGMTPGRFWEAHSPEEAVRQVLLQWFEPSDVIASVEHVEVARVVDRQRVDYRFLVRNSDGLFAVEQRAYFDVDADGRIVVMNAICSGFRSINDPALASSVNA
jgi:ketosteroid isomerase-like protein